MWIRRVDSSLKIFVPKIRHTVFLVDAATQLVILPQLILRKVQGDGILSLRYTYL